MREVFKVSKVGTVAGCLVVEGNILRTAKARLLRDNVVVWEGSLASLRRFKDDVAEVKNGFECGIGLDRFQDIKLGDVIEAYRTVEVAPRCDEGNRGSRYARCRSTAISRPPALDPRLATDWFADRSGT